VASSLSLDPVPPAAGRPISRLLFLEVLPDPGGRVSFGILGLAVLAHLFVVPDPGGYTGRFLEGAPGILGGRLFQASLEGMVEAVLVLAPAIALYGGLRHLLSRSEHLLPYLTVAGGGFLSLLTACALVCL
jgi:hypothetical protein